MNEKSLPKFSASPEKLDQVTVEVARIVHSAAAGLGIRYFLCGATARDVILTGVFGLPVSRATADLDFGVAVENWEEFVALKSALIDMGAFEASPRIDQRLYSQAHGRRIIDLIPFGGIERPPGTVTWPPGHDMALNVVGFADALASAITIWFAEDHPVTVTSLPGLAILKLLAWVDRKNSNNKDAFDLFQILRHYAVAGNEERLFTDEVALLEQADFDVDLAGAQLLGMDAAHVVSPEVSQRLHKLLSSDSDMEGITERGFSSRDQAQFFRLLENFRNGFISIAFIG